MGKVWLAEDALGRHVALKLPKVDDQTAIERFKREMKHFSGLQHEHICMVLDVGSIEGTLYLAMEYIDGVSLAEFTQPGRLLPPRDAVLLVRRLALALSVVHKRGLIHRDLKPQNVHLRHGDRNKPVLLDFGLARTFGTQITEVTRGGVLVGTPPYMSPEQLNGNPEAIGPAADVYSLGVILHQLLTGRLPFEAGDLMGLISRICFDPFPRPSETRPELQSGYDAVVLKATKKKLDERYGDMAAFAVDLKKLWKEPDFDAIDEGRATKDATTGKWRMGCPRCGMSFLIDPGARGTMIPCQVCGSKQRVPLEAVDIEDIIKPKEGESTPPPPPPPPQPQPPPPAALSRVLVVLGLVLGTGLLGLAVAVTSRQGRSAKSDGGSRPDTKKVEPERQNSLVLDLPEEVKMELRLIPKVTFMMGRNSVVQPGSEPKAIRVLIEEFYIGACEVTQKQYRAVIGTNPSWFSATGRGSDQLRKMQSENALENTPDEFPVENVSLREAREFCLKLSALPNLKRLKLACGLPNEAEWEYACRGKNGKETYFAFGNTLNPDQAHFRFGPHPREMPRKVRQYQDNGFGLYDMHGNVREWCENSYEGAGSWPVRRGGSWDTPARDCCSFARAPASHNFRSNDVGFRVVLRPIAAPDLR